MNHIKYAIPAIMSAVGVAHSAESSSEAGYGDGFIVGQARYNNKEAGLDAARISDLARINSLRHVEGGAGRSGVDYQTAYLKGYADGSAGKARGGAAQAPLPEMPIKIARGPIYAHKEVTNPETITPLQQLATLRAQFPDKDVFIVTAHQPLNDNSTDNVRILYDRKEKLFLKLSRLEIKTVEDSLSWVLILNVSEDALTESKLWSGDAPLRSIRSKHNEAKNTVPVKYEKMPKFTEWP